jgi:hypothetical protein
MEVRVHPEGPAASQLDKNFPRSQRKCCVGTQIPRYTECFTCSPSNAIKWGFNLFLGKINIVSWTLGWGNHKFVTHNCLKIISSEKKNWSQVPDGGLTPGQTGRPTVSHKMTLPCVVAYSVPGSINGI